MALGRMNYQGRAHDTTTWFGPKLALDVRYMTPAQRSALGVPSQQVSNAGDLETSISNGVQVARLGTNSHYPSHSRCSSTRAVQYLPGGCTAD